jgi:hypothetical protein
MFEFLSVEEKFSPYRKVVRRLRKLLFVKMPRGSFLFRVTYTGLQFKDIKKYFGL